MEDLLDMFLGITMLDSRYKCFDFLDDNELKQKYQSRAKAYFSGLNGSKLSNSQCLSQIASPALATLSSDGNSQGLDNQITPSLVQAQKPK